MKSTRNKQKTAFDEYFATANINYVASANDIIYLLARLTIHTPNFPLSNPAALKRACPRRNLTAHNTSTKRRPQRHKQNMRSVQFDNAAKRH